jgi:hypothetical protein
VGAKGARRGRARLEAANSFWRNHSWWGFVCSKFVRTPRACPRTRTWAARLKGSGRAECSAALKPLQASSPLQWAAAGPAVGPACMERSPPVCLGRQPSWRNLETLRSSSGFASRYVLVMTLQCHCCHRCTLVHLLSTDLRHVCCFPLSLF